MIEMICREKYVKINIVESKNVELNFLKIIKKQILMKVPIILLLFRSSNRFHYIYVMFHSIYVHRSSIDVHKAMRGLFLLEMFATV